MKKSNTLFLFLSSLILLAACSGGNSAGGGATPIVGKTVEYQFTASDPNRTLQFLFNNKDEVPIEGYFVSGWKTTFVPTSFPFTASVYVQMYDFGADLTVTLKILVNGVVVKETTKLLKATVSDMNTNILYVVN